MSKRIYLAGPDVFFHDVNERADYLKTTCEKYGLEGVFPLDSEINLEKPFNQEKNGYIIFDGNIKLIESCVAVLANISPFRSPSIDPGTAFEMGYGFANKLVVVGYTNRKTEYKERVVPDEYKIEDFCMIDNLMIHACTKGNIFDSPLSAIQFLADIL